MNYADKIKSALSQIKGGTGSASSGLSSEEVEALSNRISSLEQYKADLQSTSADNKINTLQEVYNFLDGASGTFSEYSKNATTALNNKVDKVTGKGLSTNDYTTDEKTKLSGIASGAEVNVQSDWSVADTTSDAYIKNKPSVYTQSEVDTKLNTKANSSAVTALSTTVTSNTDRITKLENDSYIGNDILLDYLSYGVEWDITQSTPNCTRVGNMQMHKTLPIQNSLKGCIFTKDGVKYYLDPNDWSKKADGTDAKLDGTDGDVGVHHTKFYIRSWTSVDGDTNKKQVRISPIKIDDSWYEVNEGVISAYCATVDTTDSTKLLARSVVSDATNMRGGGNRSANDSLDDYQTDLGKPRTSLSRATFRTYARNNGYELLDYTNYKNCIYWLFVIEYATFYSQDTFNDELTSEGYHQGGLGVGLTNFASYMWSYINSYYPLVKNGCTDSFGNSSGEITIDAVSDYAVNSKNLSVQDWTAQYCTTTKNSTSKSVTITQIQFGNTTSRQVLYASSYTACGEYTFNVTGLTDSGITLSFRRGSTVLQSITADGDVTVTFDPTVKENANIFAEVTAATGNKDCNIVVTSTTTPANVATTIDIPSYKLNRYRGIELPFGSIWLNIDGFLGHIGDDASKEEIYVTDNPDYYSDSDYSNMRYLGTMPNSGWTKTLNIGEQADIMPESIGGGGNTYMTDYCYKGGSTNTYYTLLLGGKASHGSLAGLGFFYADYGVGWAIAYWGFRLCLIIK